MRHDRSLGKLSVSLRILMVGAAVLLFSAGMTVAQSTPQGEAAPAEDTAIEPTDDWELPDALQNDPRLRDPLDSWGRELAHRDSLQQELDGIHGRAQIIGLRIQDLERDPKTLEPKDRAQYERLLSEGEKIREEEDRISVELALSRQRIRLAARELTTQLDLVIGDMADTPPEDVMVFRDRLLAWEGQIPILPTVEVVIHPDDTPDVLREKAGYLRDLADGLDGLADVLQRRLESLSWQQRLVEGAEQILEDESLFDDGASWQDQGEAPLRVRVEGRPAHDFVRGASVLFVTPEEQSLELSDLLEARPSTVEGMRSLRTLLQGAVQEVAFQRDSIRAQAGLLEEEAIEREAP